jgi:hypothetical protein
MTILRVLFITWYVATGLQVNAYCEQQAKDACPGHTTAWQRWPGIVTPVNAAAWPIALAFTIVPAGPVCDRFDVR